MGTVSPKRWVPSVADMSSILLLVAQVLPLPGVGVGWRLEHATRVGLPVVLFIHWDSVTLAMSEELGAGDPEGT